MKRFLNKIMVEMDPQMSISSTTLEYYQQIFLKFLMEKNCFEYWKIKNNQELQGMPNALKMDLFIKNCWENSYEDELTFLYR